MPNPKFLLSFRNFTSCQPIWPLYQHKHFCSIQASTFGSTLAPSKLCQYFTQLGNSETSMSTFIEA